MKASNEEYMLVNTVCANFEGYTRHNIEKAYKAGKLQGMIGSPTERDFTGMVCEKLIANCPVTLQDIYKANQIFSPDLANVWGKTTRTKPEHVWVD
jgi:hypothetical protein